MAKKEKTGAIIKINLSSKGKQTLEKVFYKWAVDAGRLIIIGIELLALGALAYRFYVDKRIVDLHDNIKRQEAYVAAQANEEKVYRSIQDRLKNIKATNDDIAAKITVMNAVLNNISSGILFQTSLSINQTGATIDGTTFSVTTLSNFIENMKSLPMVNSISLDEIDTSSEGVKFKLRIAIKLPETKS